MGKYAGDPAVERAVAIAAIAHAVDDPAQLLVYVKAIAQGVRLRQLAPKARREEVDALATAIKTRALSDFETWLENFAVPHHETRRTLLLIEEIAQRSMAERVQELVPAGTAVETAISMIIQVHEGHRFFEGDIIARDIGAALRRAVFRAAEPYAQALHDLDLNVHFERSD